MARRIELLSGLAACVIGVVGWLWAVFGPTYATGGGAATSGGGNAPVVATESRSLVQVQDIGSGPIVFLLALLVCMAAVGVGAYLHGSRRVTTGLPILLMGTLFLIGGVVLSAFTVGLFVAPAAALGLVASIAGWCVPVSARPSD